MHAVYSRNSSTPRIQICKQRERRSTALSTTLFDVADAKRGQKMGGLGGQTLRTHRTSMLLTHDHPLAVSHCSLTGTRSRSRNLAFRAKLW